MEIRGCESLAEGFFVYSVSLAEVIERRGMVPQLGIDQPDQ
jgi:hypothetical protein